LPKVDPQPAPERKVDPQPAPERKVDPQPAPAPEVHRGPHPEPEPQPAPAPEVAPQSAPAPEVDPQPAPAPEVDLQPAAAVAAAPAPERPEAPRPTPPAGLRRRWTLLVALAAAVAGLALFGALSWRFRALTVDDAAISYTYARNLAEGHGLVLNPAGERVEAYSNPAWVGILAAAHALGAPIELAAKVLGVALALAALAALLGMSWAAGGAAAGPQRRDRLLLAGAVAVVGASASVAWPLWSVAGLETALHASLVLLVVHLLALEHRHPGRPPLSAVGLLLFAWTRPEAPLYVAAAAGFKVLGALRGPTRSIRGRVRPPLAWATVLLAGLLLSLLGRWIYFDDLLPNSYWIKKITFAFDRPNLLDLSNRGWRYVGSFFHQRGLWPVLALAPFGLLRRRLRTWALPALLLLLAGLAFPVYAQGDWMPEHRFVAPLVPLLFLCAAWGVAGLQELLLARVPAGRRRLAAGLLLACTWPLFAGMALARTWQSAKAVDLRRFTRLEPVAERGRYFAAAATRLGLPGARLLDPDLGGTTWASGLEVLDLFGLGDRMLPHYRWDAPLVREYFLSELRPEFIHLHGAWFSAYFLHEYPELVQGWVRLPASPAGGSPDGHNYILRSLLANPWAPSAPAVRFDGPGLRVHSVRPAADAALPGGELPVQLQLVAERRLPAGLALELSLASQPRTSVVLAGLGRVTADWIAYRSPHPTLALGGPCAQHGDGSLAVRTALGGAPLGAPVPSQRAPSGHGRSSTSQCRWVVPVPPGARGDTLELALNEHEGRPPAWASLRVPAPLAAAQLPLDVGWLPASAWQAGEAVSRKLTLSVSPEATRGGARLLVALRSPGGWEASEAGLLPVILAEPPVGAAAVAAGYDALGDALSAALLTGRLDRSLRALRILQSYDAGREDPLVAAARRRVLGDAHTRILSLAAAGDLETAAILWGSLRPLAAQARTHRELGRKLGGVLLAEARRAAALADPEGAFGLARAALRCDPALATARTLMEEWRGLRSAAYAPFLWTEARQAGLRHGVEQTSDSLSTLVRALAAAGLDEALARLGTEDVRLRELGLRERTLVAGALRRRGMLVAAVATLPEGEAAWTSLAAGLLRQECRGLLGLEPRPGETRSVLHLLPPFQPRRLGPRLSLHGWEWHVDRDERLVVRLLIRRTSRSLAGRRLHACLRAVGETGPRRQCRSVYLPGGRVASVTLPLKVSAGRHVLELVLPGGGLPPVKLGSLVVPNRNHTFEGGSFEGWTAEGDAFSAGGAPGSPEPGQKMITGHRGRFLVNSFRGGDQATGTLRSAPFRIGAPRLSFLIGGGRGPKVGARLLVDGEIVRQSFGRNTERLRRQEWDVSRWQGREAVVEVFDQARGGWGHILFDDLQPLPARSLLPGEGAPGGPSATP